MGLVVDTSLTAVCVTRELDYIVEVRGCPRMIVSGNGTLKRLTGFPRQRGIRIVLVIQAQKVP